MLDYDTLADALAEFDPIESVAYLHGSLMAQLVCGSRLSHSDWLVEAASTLDIEADLSAHPNLPLALLYDESLASLVHMKPSHSGPELFLPAAETPLIDRIEALAQWSAGFVSTLGLVSTKVQIDAEDANVLTDLANLSQLDSHSAETEDSGEQDFAILVEHARMACRYFFERFAPPSGVMH